MCILAACDPVCLMSDTDVPWRFPGKEKRQAVCLRAAYLLFSWTFIE